MLGHVDHPGGTHVSGQLEAEVVDVGDHHVARSDLLADAGGNHPDRAGAGDQHVFADHVELQRAVGGVAERVEERGQLAGDLVGDGPQVAGRHQHVFSEGAIAVHADAHRVRAQVLATAAAVAAVAADDVALGRHPLTHLVAAHARAQGSDAADELMADGEAGLDGALAPLVPQVDMQVGAADGGLLQLDQHLVGAGLRHRHLFHPDALAGFALDQRLHRLRHKGLFQGPVEGAKYTRALLSSR